VRQRAGTEQYYRALDRVPALDTNANDLRANSSAMNNRTVPIALLALGLVALVTCYWFVAGRRAADAEGTVPAAVAEPPIPTPQEPALEPVATPAADAPEATAPEERRVVEQPPRVVAPPAEGLRRVEGRLQFPEGTPADERALVMAVRRPMKLRGLLGSPGLAEMAWDPELQRDRALIATAEIDASGRFHIDLPSDLRSAHLAVTGRYLYPLATAEVALPPTRDVTLTAELGAWVSGKLLPPPNPSPLQSDFEWIEMELGPDLAGGFDALRIDSLGVTRELEAQADGSYEFRGVPDAGRWGISVAHGHLAAHLHLGIDPAPGEHLVLDLQMVRGATLRGSVVDAGGRPVDGAQVEARYRGVLGDAIGALRSGRTSPEGTFVLEHVALGEIDLVARNAGMQPGKLHIDGELHDGDERSNLSVVLESGGRIAGRITFSDGQPAAGAEVRASPDLAQLSGLDAMKIARAQGGSAETDEAGTFEILGVSDVLFQVNAAVTFDGEGPREGRWSTSVTGVEPDGPELALVLEAMVALRGRVTDLAGDPVKEFSARATQQDTGAMFGIGAVRRDGTFDDEEGRFELEHLAPAVWDVEVSARGYATSETQQVRLPQLEGEPELIFVLEPAASVAGTVYDTEEAPVSGARVALELPIGERVAAMSSDGIPEVFTDVDGHFVMEDLDPGSVALVASHEGFAGSAPAALEVRSGEHVDGVELRLRIGGTLTGIVYDDAGEPAAGRTVIAQITPTYSAQHLLTTDGAGEFRVEHLEPGTWQVVATANLLSGETGDEIDMGEFLGNMKMASAQIVDGEETHVELGAPPADPVLLRGHVTHAGAGVPGAMITLVPEDVEPGAVMAAMKMKVTDDDGRFEVQLDHPGAYLMTVQTGVNVGQQNAVEYTQRIPDDVEEHHVAVELPGGRISGRVLGPDGQPAADCRVTMSVEGGVAFGSFMGGNYVEITTDAEGRYTGRYLRPGTYTVAAGGVALGGLLGGETESGREVRSGVRLSDGERLEGLDFRLEKPGMLSGEVLEPDGTPVVGASVFVRDEDGHLLERFSLTTTNGAGHFEYAGLAPGRYTASARVAGRASQESEPASVAAGGSGMVQLTLLDGAMLRVVVVDKTGAEVRAQVSVVDAEGREMAGMLSMADIMESPGGDFSSEEQRIGPLADGKYTVSATTADGRRAARSVSLSGRIERRVKLRLK
jgi:protocatechuate 3,4-dioxygenase beta subunit